MIMKKIILSIAVIATAGSLFAQRPTEGSNPFSLEGGLSLNSTGSTFLAPELRVRYFAMDNVAGRLGFVYNSTNVLENHYGLNADFIPTSDSTGTSLERSSMMWINIGGSYHFSQLERLSPYAFADVMIGMGSSSTEWKDFDGSDFAKGFSRTTNNSSSGLGVRFGGGVDYYFAENVFIGAEVGFMFISTTDKGGDVSVTSGGVTTSMSTLSSGNGSSFGNNATAALRLGWRF
jgi:outer membrane protein W